MLWIDFETKSQTDLIFHGLRRYARCPTTSAICMAYAFDDEDIQFWWADEGPFPQVVIDYLHAGEPVTAHNAEFEKDIFEYVVCKKYDFEPPKPTQWRCSMARALANGYPAALGALSEALGLVYKKQAQGTRLIKDYCVPGFRTDFKPGDRELMQEYCSYDVLAMREASSCLRPLTEEEWDEWHINTSINDRGIPIDVEFCIAALGYADELRDDAADALSRLTGGKMTKHTQRKARDAWLFPKLSEYQLNLLTVYKKGVKKTSLDQDHREYLLACEDLDYDARRLLELINDAGSSALKKYAVAAHMHVDGRVHGTFRWHGAMRTGRFSGQGLQPHNFRREAYKQSEAPPLIADIVAGYELDKPSETMARLLRAMVTSPKGIYYVDYSSIEGRVAPWLANCASGEKKLDLYRADKDVYVLTAAEMFDIPEAAVSKEFRQSGKLAELSLQFGGSHNALIGMAKNYGVAFEEDAAKGIVQAWRRTNPWAEQIWGAYDVAVAAAVRSPGAPFEVGRVIYQSDGANFLWCQLPDGSLLSYPKPRWEAYTTPWGEERVGATFQIGHRPPAGEKPLRNHARGALMFQNTVQAVAARILRTAIVGADDAGLDIIGHVHDEIIGEGPREHGVILDGVMLRRLSWADGLPISTGGVQHGERYGK